MKSSKARRQPRIEIAPPGVIVKSGIDLKGRAEMMKAATSES